MLHMFPSVEERVQRIFRDNIAVIKSHHQWEPVAHLLYSVQLFNF